jgi:hypothetical protein
MSIAFMLRYKTSNTSFKPSKNSLDQLLGFETAKQNKAINSAKKCYFTTYATYRDRQTER